MKTTRRDLPFRVSHTGEVKATHRYLPADSTSLTGQSGKALPLVIVAIAALILGVGTFIFTSKNSGNPAAGTSAASQSATNENNQTLARLQENLTTSLALPDDFRRVEDFSLLDSNADEITQSVFDDNWSLVFFGFTHCPDVCPITLQVMKNVVAGLEEQNAQVPQVVFVSVDPVRDTSEIMKEYIGYFNEDFIGITGDVNAIHELTRSLGIVASFTANPEEPENYSVDHTASLLLIDPQRRVRAKITPPHEAEAIATDYLAIIAELGPKA